MYLPVCFCVSFSLCLCGSDSASCSSEECRGDEEISLAVHAAEMFARREARSGFKNAADLIHRLFVCISGQCHVSVSLSVCLCLSVSCLSVY